MAFSLRHCAFTWIARRPSPSFSSFNAGFLGRRTIRAHVHHSWQLSPTPIDSTAIRCLAVCLVHHHPHHLTVPTLRECQSQQRRYKNAAKKGLHLQTLNEMAHSGERAAAEERRQKRKDKTAERKGKKGSDGIADRVASSKSNNDDHDDDEDDDDRLEEEDMDGNVLPEPAAVKRKMQRHVESFKEYLKSVRGGEATAELFDGITVTDAYGRGTGSAPLKAVAQVVMASPTLAMATCFDPATAKAVAKAILDQLELHPQVEEGGTISIALPRVSLESRQQTAAAVQQRAENYRQRIRKNRRQALDVVKQGVAGKLEGVSKDEAFRVQQEIEAMTDVVIKELNQVADNKHKDIMSV
jgi:ribosome recycling factor